jgi:hypothetical protein
MRQYPSLITQAVKADAKLEIDESVFDEEDAESVETVWPPAPTSPT